MGNGQTEIVGRSGTPLAVNKQGQAATIDSALQDVADGKAVIASLYDADVDIAGPKLIHIKTPAGSVAYLTAAIKVHALTAGAAELFEDTEVVPVGFSTALTLVNEIRTDFAAHAARANRHTTGQQNTGTMPAAATNSATFIALVNALSVFYAAHNADSILAAGWAYHSAQGADNPLTSTPTTNIIDATARLNSLKAAYNAHELLAATHAGVASVAGDQIAAAGAAFTPGLDYGTIFTEHYRKNRAETPAVAVGSYFYADPETAGNGTLLETKRIAADHEIQFGGSSGFKLKPSTSYMIKFTSDADNNKLWFTTEYTEAAV